MDKKSIITGVIIGLISNAVGLFIVGLYSRSFTETEC